MTGNAETGHGDGWEPPWPTGDAAALMWWLEEGGQAQLGSNLNKWLGLLSYVSSQIWGASNGSDRKAFRDVALASIDAGERSGAIPPDVSVEQQIYVRMSYLRNSDDSPSRRRRDMEQVVDIFMRSLPMDITSARDKSESWRDQPVSVIKSLRNVKNLLGLIESGMGFLDDQKSALLKDWVEIRPQLP